MTVENSCDIVLSHISEHPDNLYSIEDVFKKKNIPVELKGKCLSILMAKNFIKTTPTKQGTLIKVTPEGVVFSLHSSFEREKKSSNKAVANQRIAKTFGIAYKILSGMGIVAAIYFGLSDNEKKNEIKELKQTNQSLQSKIDSLLKK